MTTPICASLLNEIATERNNDILKDQIDKILILCKRAAEIGEHSISIDDRSNFCLKVIEPLKQLGFTIQFKPWNSRRASGWYLYIYWSK